MGHCGVGYDAEDCALRRVTVSIGVLKAWDDVIGGDKSGEAGG